MGKPFIDWRVVRHLQYAFYPGQLWVAARRLDGQRVVPAAGTDYVAVAFSPITGFPATAIHMVVVNSRYNIT